MADSLYVRLISGNTDIFCKCPREEERLLKNHTYIFMQILSVNIRNIHASDRDPAVSRLKIIQTVQKIHECGFSRSGAAQNAESRTGGNGQGEIPYGGTGCIFIRK